MYLRRLEIISLTHAPPPFCQDDLPIEPFIGPPRKSFVLIFHDESMFHFNEDQGWMWAEKGKQPIRPKGLGQGIMVCDFVDEFNGLLKLDSIHKFFRKMRDYLRAYREGITIGQ